MNHPIDELINNIDLDTVLSETKTTTDHKCPMSGYILVFPKELENTSVLGGQNWIDYSKSIGRCERIKYFYRTQKKYDHNQVMAVYKGKLYPLSTHYCAYVEQVCIYV